MVAGGNLHERLPIEELFVHRRQLQGPGRLAALAEEPFNSSRPEEQEQAGFRRIDVKSVRDIAGPLHDRPGDRFDHILTMLDADLAREHHEELILVSMDVQRRRKAFRRQQLHYDLLPFGFVRPRPEHPQPPVEPQRLALARPWSETTGCSWERHRPLLLDRGWIGNIAS